jgi:hypothetical protein
LDRENGHEQRHLHDDENELTPSEISPEMRGKKCRHNSSDGGCARDARPPHMSQA